MPSQHDDYCLVIAIAHHVRSALTRIAVLDHNEAEHLTLLSSGQVLNGALAEENEE